MRDIRLMLGKSSSGRTLSEAAERGDLCGPARPCGGCPRQALGGGAGPVVGDGFHDDGGGEFLHAGQGGEFVIPQDLVGLEVGGGDAEEVVGSPNRSSAPPEVL